MEPLPMGTFRGFTCVMCGERYDRHPGPDKPPVFLRWLAGFNWLCWRCDRRTYGPPPVNEVGGATQMKLELEAV